MSPTNEPSPEQPHREETNIQPAPPISDQAEPVDRLQLAFAALSKDALGLVLSDLAQNYPGQKPTIAVAPVLQSMRDAIDDMALAFRTEQVHEAAHPLALMMFQTLVLSSLVDVECLRRGEAPSCRLIAKNMMPKEREEPAGPWEAECRGEDCDWAGETFSADCPACGRETVVFVDHETGEEA